MAEGETGERTTTRRIITRRKGKRRWKKMKLRLAFDNSHYFDDFDDSWNIANNFQSHYCYVIINKNVLSFCHKFGYENWYYTMQNKGAHFHWQNYNGNEFSGFAKSCAWPYLAAVCHKNAGTFVFNTIRHLSRLFNRLRNHLVLV